MLLGYQYGTAFYPNRNYLHDRNNPNQIPRRFSTGTGLNASINSPRVLGMKMVDFADYVGLGAGPRAGLFESGASEAITVSLGRILATRIGPGPLMRASHRLRYQTYCIERQFLCAEDYPDRLEQDEYDATSAHFGVFADEVTPERMIATGRLVPGEREFPLHEYCTISSQYQRWFKSGVRAAEISRLMVNQSAIVKLLGAASLTVRKDILVALYKAMYQWVETQDISLLFAAMEPPLARLLRKTGFPFMEIGPEADYYGRVFPYVLDIDYGKLYLRMHFPETWEFLIEAQGEQDAQISARGAKPLVRVA